MKLLLLAILAIVLWYLVAPFITPRPLRPKKPGRGKAQPEDVIEGEGRIIE